jgi:peptidoglycan hydrolase CwlO-like protein
MDKVSLDKNGLIDTDELGIMDQHNIERVMEDISAAASEVSGELLSIAEEVENNKAKIQATQNQIALEAEDYNERQELLKDGTINE